MKFSCLFFFVTLLVLYSYKILRSFFMFIIAQTKKSVVLLAMMMQMSVYGITESQAKVVTVVAGVVTGAAFGNSGNPLIIGGAGLGSGGLVYNFLQKYTTKAQLAHINSELGKIKDQGYGSCWLGEGAELKPFQEHEEFFNQLKPVNGDDKYEAFILNVKKCSRGNAQYSLAVAYEQLVSLYPVIDKSLSVLQRIQGGAQADDLMERWIETVNRCENYFKELETADLWIKEHSSFAKENKGYQKLKTQSEQLKINQQIAEAESKKAAAAVAAAQAKMKQAQAEQKKANAAQSYTRLQWLKALWSWLFGKKWD